MYGLCKVISCTIICLFKVGIAHAASDEPFKSFMCEDKCWIGGNCDLKMCNGCPFSCSGVCTAPTSNKCEIWCILSKHCQHESCSACLFCNISSRNSNAGGNCPITTFEDRTDKVFSQSQNYWSLWMHSGKPYFHEGAPLFVDIDGDGILDYFNSMHGHPIRHIGTRMELGLSKESQIDNSTRILKAVSNRIIIEDDVKILDTHGEVIADLDGDGIDDLLISNGGGMGMVADEDKEYFDNLLFWGEEFIEEQSGQKVTIFRGGREAARAAGVEMRLGRGRFMYTFDINGDGLFDLFSAQDRLVTNDIAPGVLLINQGNRTWKEDKNMMEYTRAIIVTDADGDGYAEEMVLNRGFCYPKRSGPDTDQNYPELGTFTKNTERFCNTRPVGTTAVYRYNKLSEKVEEISKPFVQFWDSGYVQPTCCPHGLWDGGNNCAAISVASGDFDHDEIADHVYLYKSKIAFYFSTDRNKGDITGNPQNLGLEIDLPGHCASGESIRIIDFDNDGREEIFIVCSNAGVFLLYTRGSSKTEWSLSDECNKHGALGDINNRFHASPTLQDLDQFCKYEAKEGWLVSTSLCERYKDKSEVIAAKTAGVSIVDLNNDGFHDIVVTHTFGYLRIFFNSPSPEKSGNRYIMFDLRGEGLIKNKGVGVTFILHSTDENDQLVKQFREVASYHHAIDMSGARESRVIFGLGKVLTPYKLVLRFPNHTEKEIDLQEWRFSDPILCINDIKESGQPPENENKGSTGKSPPENNNQNPTGNNNQSPNSGQNQGPNQSSETKVGSGEPIELFAYSGASPLLNSNNSMLYTVILFAYFMVWR